MYKKKKTSGIFKGKQRQHREEMEQNLSKMNTFIVKRDKSTVIIETKNSDSYDDSMVTTMALNEKSMSLTAKEPSISTHP